MRHYSLLTLLLCIVACKPDHNEAPSEPIDKESNNLNISILIDLSDRIDPKLHANPTMDYFQRDAGYIASVASTFVEHVKQKKFRQINDRIQVYFDPEPANQEINAISQELKFDLNRDNMSSDKIAQIEDVYHRRPPQLYRMAIKDHQYVGSDTWGFFHNKVRDFCIKPGYRNLLILLTDGYIYHENSRIAQGNRMSFLTNKTIRSNHFTDADWRQQFEEGDFGFLGTGQQLADLEVLVLGINPDTSNPYEEEVIKAYWKKWFEEMGITHFEIRVADLPSDADPLIQRFIKTSPMGKVSRQSASVR